MNILHDLSLYLLYAALTVTVFLLIERSLFYICAGRDLQQLQTALHERHELPTFSPASVSALVVKAFTTPSPVKLTERMLEDRIEKTYIRVQHKLSQHLWLLDTIVTAAPLLGLLGTILGIFDTFSALASSGISDPQGVSAGIGTALLATALGIGTALVSLVVSNGFLVKVERLGDNTKLVLMDISVAHSG